jgi:transcriptional regulator with GAF, ATPase, and Fis domain
VLSPLQKLMLGIKDFGNTNFENKVIVSSNDEFEDLADSFNRMGGKLAEQFKTLETMGEIDRLILSSLDADNIVQIVLARIQEIINCDFIGIIVEDGNGELNRMYVRSLHDGKKIDEVSVFLMAKDLKLINSNPQGLVIDGNSIIPEFIDNLIYRGATGALLLPLFVDEELAAVILLGYKQLPEDSHTALQESRPEKPPRAITGAGRTQSHVRGCPVH